MMRKSSSGDYLLLFLAKGLSLFFRIMPIGVALFIARRLGELSMFFNLKRRRIAYGNLKAAFADRYSLKELKKILRRTYANIGQGLIEVLLLPKMDERYVERYIKFENFHFAKDALKRGKGLIFLTAHFGNWEVSNVALPLRGFSYKAIAREQKPFLLNELLNSYRESKGCKILLKGPAVREAIRTLRSNGIVGMLVDQDAGKNGIFVKLFGREASWHRGVMEMAMKTGASVVPGFAIREKGPYIRFKLFKPIELPAGGDKNEIIKEGFRQHVAALETMIRDYPDQWLWQHRRWKSTPVRKIVVLNDGRTGHLRQSEAVVKKLREIWVKKGYAPGDLCAKVIDVGFKKAPYRQLLAFSCNLSSFYCQGCMGCLRFCLNEQSYKELIRSYADIVVSCGSSTAAVNLMMSQESNAKSVVVMKPPFIRLKRFDLLIVPWHDNPPRLKNAVVTNGALNLIDKESLRYNSRKLQEKVGRLRERVIGVLIGGSTKDFTMDRESIDILLDNLMKASTEYDCDILLTTSRRTPKDIEDLLKQKLGREARCKLLVAVNEEKIEGAVEGILGLSGLVLVSQDSISMVSEAASSGIHTIVFKQKGLQNQRHERFLKNLSRNNFIAISDTGEVYSAISDYFKNKPKQHLLDDSSKIEKALEKLI